MFFLLVSFIAGILTVLAPCVLPILPVIVGHSLGDTSPSRRRLVIVIVSLGISVIVFTLLLKTTTLFINIPEDFWKWISGGIIFIFGLIMLFPSLWEKFSFANKINVGSNKILAQGYQKNSIWGDVIIGASLGPIFSACSPTYFVILATVLPVSFFLGLIYLLVYVLGLALALVVVVLLGEKIITKVGKISDARGIFKKIFGIIFILIAIAIISGYDKKLQISILDAGFLDVTKIEQQLLDTNTATNTDITNSATNVKQEDSRSPASTENNSFMTTAEKSKKFILAPEISTPDGFINTDGKPITLSEFKGKKVVLLDIWTYSCINCQRTIPYLNDWYKKYEKDGLVIIGLHTPEFTFEKIKANVEQAVKDFGIKYPVVLDNDFSTWRAYKNQFWPRKYLIDIDGYIVYDHAGEGGYDETEKMIQKALEERAARLGEDGNNDMGGGVSSSVNSPEVEFGKIGTPEMYFGSKRNEYLGNGTPSVSGEQTLSLPQNISTNKIYLSGTWNFLSEYAENKTGATIKLNYGAKNVYMVAGADKDIEVEVYQDGTFVKKINIKDEKLYPLVSNSDYGRHTLEIKIPSGGLQAFTFTFG